MLSIRGTNFLNNIIEYWKIKGKWISQNNIICIVTGLQPSQYSTITTTWLQRSVVKQCPRGRYNSFITKNLYSSLKRQFKGLVIVMQWLGCQTAMQEVWDSNPTVDKFE